MTSALTVAQVAMLVLFATMLAGGQMLFKVAAETTPALTGLAGVFALAQNIWAWFAMTLYGSATFLWILILQRVPITLAYPFVALGFVLVPFGAWLLFREPITSKYAVGVFFILCGIFITTR